MPSAPPELPGTSTVESPIDRALTLALADEKDAALRWAVAVLREEPASPIALLVTARLMAALGRHEAAQEGLEVCLQRSIDAGNLPMAVAASCDLRTLGADDAEHLDQIASTFAMGGARLSHTAVPPELPTNQTKNFQPLPSVLSGKALLNKAQEVVHDATQRLRLDQDERSGPPLVPPQSLFSSLDEPGLRAMIGVFDVITVPSDAVVIEEGTTGAEAYVVARGDLEVSRAVPEKEGAQLVLARLGNGALFGEMALLSRSPRAASVIARRPSVVLIARKEALDKVAAKQPEVGSVFAEHCRRRMVENLVRTSYILSVVHAAERPALVERFVTRTYEEGDKLIRQGEESDGLHLIASGEVGVIHRDGDETTVIAELGVGEVVGEVALVLRRPSNADVIASTPTVTLHLPRDHFLDLIKQHPAILAQLYELAVKRDEETTSIVAQEATEADEFVLI